MCLNLYLKSIFAFLIVSAVNDTHGQNLSSSIKSEMKKELLKQVSPSVFNTQMRQTPEIVNKAVDGDNLIDFIKKRQQKSGGEEFDSPYKINPNAVSYNSNIPINQITQGKVVPIYTGGHFVLVNPSTNGLGLIYPSGLDLSGYKKKKMSAKTKQLLELLFNVKIEDE